MYILYILLQVDYNDGKIYLYIKKPFPNVLYDQCSKNNRISW